MPQRVDGAALEELVTPKLEGALHEVAGDGRPEAGGKGAGALLSNDAPQPAKEPAGLVLGGRELDSCLDTACGISTWLVGAGGGI